MSDLVFYLSFIVLAIISIYSLISLILKDFKIMKLKEQLKNDNEIIKMLINRLDKAIKYVEDELLDPDVITLNGEEFVLYQILQGEDK